MTLERTHDNSRRGDRSSTSTITTRRATADEIAFRDGYVQGRAYEQQMQRRLHHQIGQRYAHRSMTAGILFGILLTLTVGFAAVMLAILSPGDQPTQVRTTTQTNSAQ